MSEVNSSRLADLWTRHLSGEAMAADERATLAEAFASDEVFRRRVLHDHRLEGALRAEADIQRKQPQLLAAVHEALITAVRSDRLIARLRPHLESAAEDARVARHKMAERAERRRAWTKRGVVAGLVLAAGMAAALVGTRPGTWRSEPRLGVSENDSARARAVGLPQAGAPVPASPGAAINAPAVTGAESTRHVASSSEPRLAVFVTGADDPRDLEDQNSSDDSLRARLEQLGFTVHFLLPDGPITDEIRRARVVVLSPSVATPALSAELIALPVPIVALESSAFIRLGLTGAGWERDLGNVPTQQSDLVITHPGEALAAGLSGQVAVLSRRHRMRWGIPGPQGISIASYPGAPGHRSMLFAYERGVTTPGGVAPARRVAMFLGNAQIVRRLTPIGWRLFDAAVTWCADDVK